MLRDEFLYIDSCPSTTEELLYVVGKQKKRMKDVNIPLNPPRYGSAESLRIEIEPVFGRTSMQIRNGWHLSRSASSGSHSTTGSSSSSGSETSTSGGDGESSSSGTSEAGSDTATQQLPIPHMQGPNIDPAKVPMKRTLRQKKETFDALTVAPDSPKELVKKMKQTLKEELEKKGIDEQVILDILAEIQEPTQKLTTLLEGELTQTRGMSFSESNSDPILSKSLSRSISLDRTSPMPHSFETLRVQKRETIHVESHTEKGCPLCGSVSGSIDTFDLKAWQRAQILIMKQESILKGEAKEYFGFELYFKWKQLQEKLKEDD